MKLNAFPTFGELTATTNDLYLENGQEMLLVLAPGGGDSVKRLAESVVKNAARRKGWGKEVVFASVSS